MYYLCTSCKTYNQVILKYLISYFIYYIFLILLEKKQAPNLFYYKTFSVFILAVLVD